MNNNSSNRESETTHSHAAITANVPLSEDGPDREVTLSPAQQQTLECLISGQSISKAAKFAGVSRQTIYRWIQDDVDFQTVYASWRLEVQKSMKDRMLAIGDFAMDNIANAVRFKGNLRASEFVVKHLLAQKEK